MRRHRPRERRKERRSVGRLSIAVAAASVLVAAAIWVARSPRRPAGANSPPNVLLISVDTLRADHIGAYGGTVATPTVDALAKDGVLFENAVAHAPFTLPSHASILTGTYPVSHGVRNNGMYHLAADVETLAERFRVANYRTAAFVGAYVLDSRFGLDQGFEVYDDELDPETGNGPARTERVAGEVLSRASAWLLGREHDERWFAFVHLFDPHAPYVPPEPFRSDHRERPYAGEIAYVDYELGRFFDRLEAGGRLDETLVVLTADHGEGLGEHREATHGMFAYETTLRVPLILSWPGVLPEGARVSTRVRHIDLAPTLTAIAGVSPGTYQGESLLRLVDDPAVGADRDSYFESVGFAMNRGTAPLTGLYRGRYKYIHLPLPELYDLGSDPNEQHNLVDSRAATARELMASLEEIASQPPIADEGRDSGAHRDEELVDRLASLGYLTGSSSDPAKIHFAPEDDPKRLVHVAEWIDDGTQAFQRGELGRATELFEKVIAERPQTGTAYLYLARVYRRQGRDEGAIDVLRRAVDNGLGSPTILFDLASALQKTGRAREAVEVFAALTEADPHDALAFEGRGIAHLMLDEYAEAARAFERALALEPDWGRVHANLAAAYVVLGQLDEAERSTERAIELDATLASAWVNLGDIRWEQSRPADALDAWQHALQLSSHDPSLVTRIAYALASLGRSKEAIALLENVVRSAGQGAANAQQLLEEIQRFEEAGGGVFRPGAPSLVEP